MPVLRPRRGGKRRDDSVKNERKNNSIADSKEQTEAVSKSKKVKKTDENPDFPKPEQKTVRRGRPKKAQQQDKLLTFAEDDSDLKTSTSQEKVVVLEPKLESAEATKPEVAEVVEAKPKRGGRRLLANVVDLLTTVTPIVANYGALNLEQKQLKAVSLALYYGDEKEVKETRTRGRQRQKRNRKRQSPCRKWLQEKRPKGLAVENRHTEK